MVLTVLCFIIDICKSRLFTMDMRPKQMLQRVLRLVTCEASRKPNLWLNHLFTIQTPLETERECTVLITRLLLATRERLRAVQGALLRLRSLTTKVAQVEESFAQVRSLNGYLSISA
jgi:hypothetical protein